MRISDWSSDVCSSDLRIDRGVARKIGHPHAAAQIDERRRRADLVRQPRRERDRLRLRLGDRGAIERLRSGKDMKALPVGPGVQQAADQRRHRLRIDPRSEEHTSELQSLMRTSYAVFCLKKKKTKKP